MCVTYFGVCLFAFQRFACVVCFSIFVWFVCGSLLSDKKEVMNKPTKTKTNKQTNQAEVYVHRRLLEEKTFLTAFSVNAVSPSLNACAYIYNIYNIYIIIYYKYIGCGLHANSVCLSLGELLDASVIVLIYPLHLFNCFIYLFLIN